MINLLLIAFCFPIIAFLLIAPITLKTITLIKNIFWITFVNMFLQHAFFRDYFFDFHGSGYATIANWCGDYLLLIAFVKLLFNKNYSKNFFQNKIFICLVFLIYFSSLLNFKGIIFSVLSLRGMYIYLLLAYVIYISNFTMKEYENFFKTFFVLAFINSTASILQFPFYGYTHDQTGGIFGFHGTGLSAIFSVCNSIFCFQLYLITKKKYLIPSSIYLSIPIITGFAYGGFLYLIMGFVLLFFYQAKDVNLVLKFRYIFLILLFIPLLGYAMISLIVNLQSANEYLTYVRMFTEYEVFYNYFINRSDGMGRIGTIIFTMNRLSENIINFLFGYGPGSVSYKGYFSGIENSTFIEYGITSLNNMFFGYFYEMGFIGIAIMVYIIHKLYHNYKKSSPPKSGNFLLAVYKNYPITIAILFSSFLYTTTMKYHFLVIYYAFYFSFVKTLSCSAKNK